MKRSTLYIYFCISLTFLFSCESKYSQYEIGDVPASNEVFYQNYLDKINEAIEKSPSNAELYYVKAGKLLESKQYNSALRTIERALNLLKNDEQYKYHLLAAKIYSESGQYEKSLQQIKKINDYGQNSAHTDALLAKVLWRQGNYHLADSASQLAISKDPFNPEYFAIRGKILWSMNDTLTAKENLLKSIELGPASTVYQQLLEIYLAEKSYEEGFQVLNHLISLHSDDLSLQYRKAEIYANIEQEEKARSVYRNIINEHPESQDAYYNLSDMYLEKLRYDSAIYFQNQLIARDSANAEPYLNLARIYDRRFWYTIATDYYQRYLQLQPDNLLAQQELEQVENKIRYVNRLQQERERLSNASKLRTIKKEQPKKIE